MSAKSAHVPHVKLNDNREIPVIGFGTWKIPQDVAADQVSQAIELGFSHVDTAQVYRNELEAGKAIRESGLERDAIWVTTKWSGVDGKSPRQSCMESLEKLGLKYVDLYLIHSPRLANGNIPAAWDEIRKLKEDGLVKSIGVSNFSIADLKVLLYECKVVPAVNQILFHPYVWEHTEPLVNFMNEHGIRAEAYSALYPLTSRAGGEVDKTATHIAKKRELKPEQVLLAWVIAKSGIPLTTSSKAERIKSYLEVPHIHLTPEEVEAIDEAGKKTDVKWIASNVASKGGKWVLVAALAGWIVVKGMNLA